MTRWLVIGLAVSMGLNFYLLSSLQQRSAGVDQPPVPDLLPELWPAAKAPSKTKPMAQSWESIQRDLQYLFLKGEIGLAVDALIAESDNFPLQTSVLLDGWMEQASSWLETGGVEKRQWVFEFLEGIAKLRYQSVDYLLLRADWLFGASRHNEAIDLYIEQLNTTSGRLKAIIAERFDTQMQATFAAIQSARLWEQGLAITERLLWHRPDNGEYQLMRALFAIELGQFDQARQSLLVAKSLAGYRHQADELLSQLEKANRRRQAIPLDRKGASQFIASGKLAANSSIKLLVDTGATLSAMDRRVFARIRQREDVQFIQNMQFNTAGGLVNAPIYRFRSFSIGDYVVENIDFSVMDLAGAGSSDGLLGMNFLANFKFEIDQDNALLYLSPRD